MCVYVCVLRTFAVDTSQQHAFNEQIAFLHHPYRVPIWVVKRVFSSTLVSLSIGARCRLVKQSVVTGSYDRRRSMMDCSDWQYFLRVVDEEVEDDVHLWVVLVDCSS